MRRVVGRLFILVSSFMLVEHSFACTDVRVMAKDKTVVIGRTLEFAEDLNSNVRSAPRGTAFNNKAPDGSTALSWKSKYGYVYVDALNVAVAVDGINEKGLSFEYLFLPGETQYQTVPAQKQKQAVPYYYFGDWILGNFSTVEELRKELANIIVFEQTLPGLDKVFPLHASVFDSTGKGIVIEFVEGKMVVYNNEAGIMTNSPLYDWHMINLRNYTHLSPYTPTPVIVNGMTFAATGQGSGMLGLPGDISPPSRFVKMAALSATAIPAETAGEALNLVQHFLNTVDIPRGFVRAKTDGADAVELTQWAVFKDLTNKVLYYRTYNDMTTRALSLDKVNLAENAPLLKMPLAGKPIVIDVTEHFLKQAAPTDKTPAKSAELTEKPA